MTPRLRKLIGLFGILVFLLLYIVVRGGLALGLRPGPRPAAVRLLRPGRRQLGHSDPAADQLDEPGR